MRFLIISFIVFQFNIVLAQKPSGSGLAQLQQIELQLKVNSDSIINAQNWLERFNGDAEFTRGLVKALKVPYSFNYSFDSVHIAQVYAPDSSFKIFTWQICKDFTYYMQKGAIQIRTADGSLKLFPLFDYSDYTKAPNDSVRACDKWIGAIYYKVILKTYNNKKYYTLLGRDDNNEKTNKKWIDILTFDEEGKPQFGRTCFIYPNDGLKPPQPCYRFNLEFRKNAGVTLKYDEKLDEIIFDKLISENNEPAIKSSLIPYGEYEGFRWQNGKWYYTAQPYENVDNNSEINIYPKPILEQQEEPKKKKKKRYFE